MSTQPGQSSCSSGRSSRVGIYLSTPTQHLPFDQSALDFDDQPGLTSLIFDDLESYPSSPSTSHQQRAKQEMKNVNQLISVFVSRVPVKQIQTLYQLSGESFDDCVDCLLNGPTTELIMKVVNKHYLSFPTT